MQCAQRSKAHSITCKGRAEIHPVPRVNLPDTWVAPTDARWELLHDIIFGAAMCQECSLLCILIMYVTTVVLFLPGTAFVLGKAGNISKPVTQPEVTAFMSFMCHVSSCSYKYLPTGTIRPGWFAWQPPLWEAVGFLEWSTKPHNMETKTHITEEGRCPSRTITTADAIRPSNLRYTNLKGFHSLQ